MAKLTRSGLPRRKPGPKPKTVDLQASEHSAVIACISAYESASDPKSAAQAFRRAMPPMHTVTVADWAGIVAQGMARQVLSGKEASTMLHAASVAQASSK